MLLQEGADYENRVDRKLLISHAQITLSLHGELGKSHSQTASKIVVLSVNQRVSEGQVRALVLALSGGGSARGLIFQYDSLSSIATICENHSLSDNFGACVFDLLILFLFLMGLSLL
jgi:hypothetical protein